MEHKCVLPPSQKMLVHIFIFCKNVCSKGRCTFLSFNTKSKNHSIFQIQKDIREQIYCLGQQGPRLSCLKSGKIGKRFFMAGCCSVCQFQVKRKHCYKAPFYPFSSFCCCLVWRQSQLFGSVPDFFSQTTLEKYYFQVQLFLLTPEVTWISLLLFE